MHRTAATRNTARGTFGPTAVCLVVLTVSIIGTLAYQTGSSSASTVRQAPSPDEHRAEPQSAPSSAPSFSEIPRGDRGDAATEDSGAVTEDDGVLPAGVTVFDDGYPGLANLDPALLHALGKAASDAVDDGIEFYVNSGWRSPAYQDQLRREAVSKYGSEREAARWVATSDTSAHVSGDAVDIGAIDAAAWLSEHGAHYGLCQIYRNESWHFELRPEAIENGCPPMYADSAHGPSTRP